MSGDPVYRRNIYIAAPAQMVWQALVTPTIVSQYFLCPLQWLELEVGGEMFYGSNGRRFIDAFILELEPGERLVHSFSMLLYLHEDAAYEPPTRVTYELFPLDKMCLLELKHDGFTAANQFFQDVCEAWETVLSGLKTVVETGQTMPWPKQRRLPLPVAA